MVIQTITYNLGEVTCWASYFKDGNSYTIEIPVPTQWTEQEIINLINIELAK